jgi:hypothetical protein
MQKPSGRDAIDMATAVKTIQELKGEEHEDAKKKAPRKPRSLHNWLNMTASEHLRY